MLVFGKTQEEHDQNLTISLGWVAQENIKFNEEKCKFSVKELKFVGHIINFWTVNHIKAFNNFKIFGLVLQYYGTTILIIQ